jgi:hypothetical protein
MSTQTKTPASIVLRVNTETVTLGLESQFYALMSSISVHLEPRGWGTKYPMLMRRLYPGLLGATDVRAALDEMADVQTKLAKLKADKVVWDVTDPHARPDSSLVWLGAPSLLDAFTTPNGERTLDVMMRALIVALKTNSDVRAELKTL